MTVTRYPAHAHGVGSFCWCGSMFLAAHISSMEVDATVHARGWCQRLRPVPQVTP